MSIQLYILQGPLGAPPAWNPPAGHGALICFEGVARGMEEGKPILALDYEAYEPMAQKALDAICRSLIEKHGLLGICVEHSKGRVAAGECSFRLRIASRHRKEGLLAMDQFIDALKRDVPIWKKTVWA